MRKAFLKLFIPSLIFTSLNVHSIEGLHFRFQNTFGTTNQKFHQNDHYYSKDDFKFSDIIKDLATNYTDRNTRMEKIADVCSGMNEFDRIRLGRALSESLSGIYDYERSDGKNNNDIVTTDDQWRGLHNLYTANGERVDYGVCRDMTSTVTELLLSCGIEEDRIKIVSYSTPSGGHQIVQVTGHDQETYTINWAELKSTKNGPLFNDSLNPGIPNVGFTYRTFDPKNGQVLEVRKTELGAVIDAVLTGQTDDPNYLPQILQLEAMNDVMNIGIYKARTRRGDFLDGVKMSFQAQPTKYLHLSAGTTFANNKYQQESWLEINQYLSATNISTRISLPSLKLLDEKSRSIILSNTIEANEVIYIFKTFVNDNKKADLNFDINLNQTATTQLAVRDGSNNLKLTAKLKGGEYVRYNNEKANKIGDGLYPYPYYQSFTLGVDYQREITKGQFLGLGYKFSNENLGNIHTFGVEYLRNKLSLAGQVSLFDSKFSGMNIAANSTIGYARNTKFGAVQTKLFVAHNYANEFGLKNTKLGFNIDYSPKIFGKKK